MRRAYTPEMSSRVRIVYLSKFFVTWACGTTLEGCVGKDEAVQEGTWRSKWWNNVQELRFV
jgi:hypothetical protein